MVKPEAYTTDRGYEGNAREKEYQNLKGVNFQLLGHSEKVSPLQPTCPYV